MAATEDQAEDNRPRHKKTIEWRTKNRDCTIEVYGSWNRFERPTVLRYSKRGVFACEVDVPAGEHYYRFLVDDDWETDDRVSKTVKLGNEYNTLVAETIEKASEKTPAAAAADAQDAGAGDGAESIMYDSVSRSFKVGRSTATKSKSKRRTRNRPSMEISLPPSLLKESQDAQSDDDEGDDKAAPEGSGKRRRDKKRKRKRRPKSKRSGKGYEFSPDHELEKAFKKKEEEWARMCFVQQLRQQQAHNDEINRVKSLWKQERQVRVEMHKKALKAKSELETDLRNTTAELSKIKKKISLDQTADSNKVALLSTEQSKLEEKLKEQDDAKKKLEAELRNYKKDQSAQMESAGKDSIELKKSLIEFKEKLEKAETEVTGLSKKNENLEESLADVRAQNKKAIEEEKNRIGTLKSSNKEDQELISKLRTERNQLEADLRTKTTEATEAAEKSRTLEASLDDAKTQEQDLSRKIKQLATDTSAAEAADKNLREATDAYEKKTKDLQENIDRMTEKNKTLEARVADQKTEMSDQLLKLKTESEANMSAMSKSGTDSEKRLTELSAQLEKANTDTIAAKEEIRALTEKVTEATAEAERKAKGLAEVQATLDETKKTAGETADNLAAATRDLNNTKEELKASQDSLAKTKESSSSKADEMGKQIVTMREQTNKNESVITGLREETEKQKAQINELNETVGKAGTDFDDIKEQLSIAQSTIKDKEVNEQTLEEKLKKADARGESQKTEMQTQIATISASLATAKKQAADEEEKAQEKFSVMEAEKNSMESNFKKREAEFIDLETKVEQQKADFEIEKNTWGAERDSLKAKVDSAQAKDQKILQCCKNLFKEFEAVRASMDQVRSLKLDELERMNEFFPNFQELLNKTLDFNAKLVKDTMEKYKRELSLRRKYFNIVQELRGNIRVFCRCRPLLPPEIKRGVKTKIVFPMEEDFVLEIPSEASPDGKFVFEYDRVYKPKTTQEAVSEDTSEYIQSVMDGYNVSIFAYGQTGSGKTHTMDGPLDNPGVNLRALEELFRIAEERKPMFEYTITMSVFEIYNDKVACLLHSPKERKTPKGPITFKCRLNNDGSVYVENAREVEVKSKSEVVETLTRAKKYRKTANTKMNETSSRSHMILVVNVRGFNVPANIEYLGKLFLVDLAGSERVSKSGVKGARLKEATEINKSLTALGDVMQALQKKAKFVPYRNSTLTYLMQNALGGHAKTVMFINISPDEVHTGETLSSLRFAQRVAKVELGKATKTFKKIDKLNAKAKGKSKTKRGKR